MLVFFKPWRSGKDLKANTENWDTIFRSHDFTERQVTIMKNFHIKHECHDAKDDHYAQRKKNAVNSGHLPGNISDYIDDMHYQSEVDKYEDSEDLLERVRKQSNKEGRGYQNNKNLMNLMKSKLILTGWTDRTDVDIACPQFEHFDSGLNSTAQWSDLLQTKKEEVIRLRTETIAKEKQVMAKQTEDQMDWVDTVKEVDRSYLQMDFQMQKKEDKQLTTATIMKFSRTRASF